jgi:hypothetical protein
MKKMTLLMLRRRVQDGAERIARQKSLIAGLEHNGAGPKWLKLAYDLLKAMQISQGYIEDTIINLALDALDDWTGVEFIPAAANDATSAIALRGARSKLPGGRHLTSSVLRLAALTRQIRGQQVAQERLQAFHRL